MTVQKTLKHDANDYDRYEWMNLLPRSECKWMMRASS